jgi:hypothetical protein
MVCALAVVLWWWRRCVGVLAAKDERGGENISRLGGKAKNRGGKLHDTAWASRGSKRRDGLGRGSRDMSSVCVLLLGGVGTVFGSSRLPSTFRLR